MINSVERKRKKILTAKSLKEAGKGRLNIVYGMWGRRFSKARGFCFLGNKKTRKLNAMKLGIELVIERENVRSRGINQATWKKLRKSVFESMENSCQACCSSSDLTVDHILPVKFWPELRHEVSNLQILCRSCNSKKGVKCL
jgi:hypothetical protein